MADGSIIVPRRARPSWAAGFAREQSGARFPFLWDRLAWHWATSLGATGGTLFDVSGRNKDHGSIFVATWNAESLSYNGSTTYVDLGIPDSQKITGSMSISIAMRGESSNASGFTALGTMAGGSNRGFAVGPNNSGTISFAIPVASGSFVSISASGHDASVWMHYVCVYDASKSMTMYRDGVQVAIDTSGIPAAQYTGNGITPKIGRRGDSSGDLLGDIGDVAFWSRALSPSEIQLLYTRSLAGSNAILERKSRVFPVATAAPPAGGNPWNYYAQQAALVG